MPSGDASDKGPKSPATQVKDYIDPAKEVTKLACLNRRLIFHGPPGDFLSDAALTALYGPSVHVVSHEH